MSASKKESSNKKRPKFSLHKRTEPRHEGSKKVVPAPPRGVYIPNAGKPAFWPHLRIEKKLEKLKTEKNQDGSFRYPILVEMLEREYLTKKLPYDNERKRLLDATQNNVQAVPEAVVVSNDSNSEATGTGSAEPPV